MLDPQHLRTFQEIARTGTYTAAARKLGYTQPALSYQMRVLERAIGAPLTVRTGRSVQLTRAGQTLLRHAEQILTAIRVAERDIAQVVGSGAGVVRIATFASAGASVVPAAIAAVVGSHPVDVRIFDAEPDDARSLVTRGEAELAVTYRYEMDEVGAGPGSPVGTGHANTNHRSPVRSPLARVGLLTDDVHVVLPARHPLADSPPAGFWPLADETWLIATPMFADLLQRMCAVAGFAARITMVSDDYVAMQALVAQGVGIALLPGLALAAHRRDDVAAHVLAPWPRRIVEVEKWPDLMRIAPVSSMVTALTDAAGAAADGDAARQYVHRLVPPDSPPDGHAEDGDLDHRWERSFRIAQHRQPSYALNRPDRAVLVSDQGGTDEVYEWDRTTGQLRQVTSRHGGTAHAQITPDGEYVWWFADDDGDEFGVWMVQPFGGGPARPAAPDVAAGFAGGLVLGPSRALVSRSSPTGAEIYVVTPDGSSRLVYEHPGFAVATALSADEEFVAISHSERGDAQKPAVRVIRIDRDIRADSTVPTVGELWDGPGFGLWPVAFSPEVGSTELLVVHERQGRSLPLVWDPVTGRQREFDLPLAGESEPQWAPDGRSLVLLHQLRARSELYRLDLATDRLTRLTTPRGHIRGAYALDADVVHYEWSSAEHSHRLLSTPHGDRAIVGDHGPGSPDAIDAAHPGVDDITVAGTAGDIHALVTRPDAAPHGPQPTVFLVHGGPADHEADEFSPVRNAWISAGFAVAQVNYRGSTGFGTEWRNANIGRPGRAELEDVVAVRDALVADGTTDPERTVISGFSWGGYLALLGLGLYPDLWRIGVAWAPVADTAAVYEDMMAEIQAAYRVRFGGSPTEVPDVYTESSPLGVVDEVRAPVLVTGGLRDRRCPIRQIELYVSRLVELGKQHELHEFGWGHEPRSMDARSDVMDRTLRFVRRHLGPAPSEA
ncbi:hypothetical protein BH24ACT5_BH24ACT5_18710 [soil metagenome]